MKHNRRNFLINSASALTMAALATQMRHFGMVSALAQTKSDDDFAPPSDYRALVCISLDGGNDGNNMIVPKHSDANITGYPQYAAARAAKGLAIARNELLSIGIPRLGGLEYGFHYNFSDQTANGGNRGIHELWAAGRLAVVSNVGTLIRPMTRQQYLDNSVPKPYQLGSHFDQQAQMYSSRSDVRSQLGWGGRISDLRTTPDNPASLLPMISSINGSSLFTLGNLTRALSIADADTPLNQVFVLNGQDGNDLATVARRTIYNRLRTRDLNSGELVRAASHINGQAVVAGQVFSSQQEVTVQFPNSDIGKQLKQVARIIRKRGEVNINRQIFFCHFGGFDTHNGQVSGTGDGQNGLLLRLSQAMRAFYDEMNAQGLQNNVTTFTLSEFGRTFDPADSGINVGSDHAWGNHLLVMGGAVRGGDIYGSLRPNGTGNIFPTLINNGPDDADVGSAARGRWIPTSSVDQYAATLARWFGVPENELNAVFPNLPNFASSDLGFMNA